MERKIFGKSVRGASHLRSGTECQDSWRKIELEDGTVILAAADGHGNKSCTFSKTGSQIAVNVFCDIMKNLCEGYKNNPEQLPTCLNREGETAVSKAIDAEWKRRVIKCHKKNKREIPGGNYSDVYRQYGSTLLGLLIANNFIFAFQLGDGDICYVTEKGLEKIIEPEKILGVETHSLSRENSWQKAITAVRIINAAEKIPALFTLTTDGYANSYKSENEFHAALKDYLSSLTEHGVKAVVNALPGWLSETSELGCGDDITLVGAYFT